MANPTTNLGITLPTVGGSDNSWGTILNDAFQSLDDIFVAGGTAISVNIDGGTIDGVAIGGTSASTATFTSAMIATATMSTATVSTSVTIGSSAASAGAIRLANAAKIASRNAAGSADIDALSVDGSNVVLVGADTDAASVQVGATGVPTTIVGNATLSANLIHSSSTASIGFFGATPVGKQTAPISLALTGVYGNDEQDIEDAVNGIITALTNLGIM